jgi:hypothetical protein
MRNLMVGLVLAVIPCFAAGSGSTGGSGTTTKVAATFIGIVLAAMLRAWLFGDKK